MSHKITTAALVVLLASTAAAQNVGRPPDLAEGVQNRFGNTSPDQGFSTGQGNSRIDDYFNQDEQININPDTGVVKVLRVNQKNLINDFVTAVFPVKNVDAREIRNVFELICAKEGGTATLIRDNVKMEENVQVMCPAYMLPWFERAVAALDHDWVKQAVDGSKSTRHYLNYRPADSVDFLAHRYAGSEGVTEVDQNRSLILRRDEPARADKYMKAVAELFDVPPPQAMLQFKIYEVDTNNDLKVGVDWIAWKNGPGRSLFEVLYSSQDSRHQFENATSPYDPNLGSAIGFFPGESDLQFQSTQYLLSANYLLTSAYLDFLRVKGKARVLAEPELFTITGVPASWTSVDQILAFDSQPSDPSAFGTVPTRLNTTDASVPTGFVPDGFSPAPDFPAAHNRFLNHSIRGELGLFLDVVAVIGTESSEIDLTLQSTDLAGTTPQGTPIITNRTIDTKIRLVDGQPFVFGGLTRDEDVEASNKAPWLGDIPVLGYLFGQETTSARRKELVITCVPHFYQGCPKEVTDAVELDTISMATGAKEIEVPDNSFGFDDWMFDTIE
ncbi:MAG: type II secretion system protein GspD [Planctomycetota bacterium JB042]